MDQARNRSELLERLLKGYETVPGQGRRPAACGAVQLPCAFRKICAGEKSAALGRGQQ